MADSRIYRRRVRVTLEHGLHIRPCTMIAQLAAKFQSRIQLTNGNSVADAKSVLDLMTLAASQGTDLELLADGPDGAAAVEQVEELFSSGFSAPRPAVPAETAAL